MAIWFVAFISNSELTFHQLSNLIMAIRDLGLVESQGLGLFVSFGNLILLYICFRIDKHLALIDDSCAGFHLISIVSASF